MIRNRMDIVIPGTVLNPHGEKMQTGSGTFRKEGDIVAKVVGFRNERGGYMNLIPLGGRYIPMPGKNDLVIGIITFTGQSFWTVDINSPYTAMLHVNDTPWKVDFAETPKYLNIGDVIIARISDVGALKKVYVSIKEKGMRRLDSGHIVEMAPSKVPRVIGKKGSMLSLLKAYTDCRIFVGQNGRLWVQGKTENVLVLEEAVRRIEAMSHMPGLTTEIEAFLRSRLGEPKGEYGERHGRDDRRDHGRGDRGPDRREERPGTEDTAKAPSEGISGAETAEPVGETATGGASEESVEALAVDVADEPAKTEAEGPGVAPTITIVGSNGGPAESAEDTGPVEDTEMISKNEKDNVTEEGE